MLMDFWLIYLTSHWSIPTSPLIEIGGTTFFPNQISLRLTLLVSTDINKPATTTKQSQNNWIVWLHHDKPSLSLHLKYIWFSDLIISWTKYITDAQWPFFDEEFYLEDICIQLLILQLFNFNYFVSYTIFGPHLSHIFLTLEYKNKSAYNF